MRIISGSAIALGLHLLVLCQGIAAQSDCRENLTRAHLTRCDKYFQCVVLPSKRIIWVSKQCDEGLVYDTEQAQCVVPDSNWECELGEEAVSSDDDESVVHHLKGHAEDQENVYGVKNIEDYIGRSEESSGAGAEEDQDGEEEVTTEYASYSSEHPDQEFSGDGTETTLMVDASTEAVEMPITKDEDGTLVSYLQRLTQLIDGFRKNGGSTEITPDQLNSFVAMHKIKNYKNYDSTGTHLLPENGQILKPHLEYILKKQFDLNTVETPKATTTTTTTTTTTPRPIRRRIIHIIRPYHRPEPEDNSNIQLSSQYGGGNETGYGSNSQIVVNRPEGSVLFSIARPASEAIPSATVIEREPTITQDTLKSVLELSKQLVSHQKYLSEKPQYLPPVVQPVYYPFTMPVVQQGSKVDYFNGEAVPVIKENATKPINNRPLKYENNQEVLLEENYNRPNKYTEEKDKYSSYLPIQPVNPYQGKYPSSYNPNENYNSNHQPFGYYNSGLNGFQNQPNYNSENYQGHQQLQGNNYNYNSDLSNYNQHRPPFYDASGLGQSAEYHNQLSSFNPNHYSNQFSQNYPSNSYPSAHYTYPQQPQQDVTEEESSEEHHNSESSEETQTSVTTTTEKPAPTLSPLQILSQQLLLDKVGNRNKIVGINGNYMSFDTYKDTILPILNTNNAGESNLEVVSCSLGVRQANASDCTRYYVCNPKNRELLGYICPPYTAFNEFTRICDANSYALCKPDLLSTRFTIQENKRLQYEAQKTLQEAKRIRDQALQVQYVRVQEQQPELLDEPEHTPILHKIKQKLRRKKPQTNAQPAAASSTANRPSLLHSLGTRKRKYKCTDAGQAIPDVLSSHKYFVCFKDTQGTFKRRSMACSKGLIFCSKRRMCTLRSRC